MLLYDEVHFLRLEHKGDPEVDIIIRLSDITSMKQDYENGVLEIHLRPKSIERINKYFNIFNHEMTIRKGTVQHVEVQFSNASDHQLAMMQNFFS